MNQDSNKRKPAGGVPPINIRALYEERNWAALGGLGLMALGVLWLIEGALNLNFNLWSVGLVGLGGWLALDSWQKYDAAGRVWVDNTRNKLFAGVVMALLGLMGIFEVSVGSLLLLGLGGWLGYDTWQKYEAQDRVWTDYTRNRAAAAVIIGTFGLFGLLHVGSAWSLLLIVGGAIMIYRHFSQR